MKFIKNTKRNIIFVTLIIAVLVIISLYIYFEFFTCQEARDEPIREIDNNISPFTQQAVFFQVQRIRRKGIIDQMTDSGKLVKIIGDLPIKDKKWIVEGKLTGYDIVQMLKGILPGNGWDEKPIFTYNVVIDDFKWNAEKTEYNTWDTGYIFNEFYKTVEEENNTAEIEFKIIEKVKVKKLFGTDTVEEERGDFKVFYDFRNGSWTGGDFFNDSDGYGHYDGTYYEIWFDIRQTDYDGDKIPYWTEVNILGTNPKVDDSKLDPDNDGIPTTWEWKWGYDPMVWDNHTFLDPDMDGLQNIEEYYMEKWLANPYYPEIYLEVDYSDKAPFTPFKIEWEKGKILPIQRLKIKKTNLWGQKHIFWKESQEMIIDRFNQHGITVHIDDGCMNGGGDILPFLSSGGEGGTSTVPHQISEFYNNYFSDERKGIFRYLIVAHTGGWAYNMDYSGQYDTMVVGQTQGFYIRQTDFALSPRAQRVSQAVSIIHEMGHTFGFGYFHNGGVDNMSQEAFVKWYNYKSAMNYFWYRHRYFDYSDGSHGPNDVNDWEALRLYYFQSTFDDGELEGIDFDPTEPPHNRGERG